MSAPTDTGIYNSESIFYELIGGVNELMFYSLPTSYVAIGQESGKIYYESTTLSAEVSVLYAWGKDSTTNRVSDKLVQAIGIKLVEL